MRGIIKQILLAAKKDSLFLGTSIAVIVVTLFAFFLGSNSLIEAQQAKIVYTAAISRLVIILGFTIFMVFYIKRLFENREIEVILSRPISRLHIILSMGIGFACLFVLICIPLFFILVLLLKVNFTWAALWMFSLIIEGISVLSFTLFFSLLISSSVYSLVFSMLAYILCRTIGSFVAYLSLAIGGGFYIIAESILKITSILIPRFDLFAKSSWLLYGDYSTSSILLALVQGIVFISIMFFASVFDFKRKQF